MNKALTPGFAQVLPLRVLLFDQCQLFRSLPTFQLFFSCNCGGGRGVTLEPDQVMAAMFFGESVMLALFVLLHSEFQVTGHAYVQDSCTAGHDVGIEGWRWHL